MSDGPRESVAEPRVLAAPPSRSRFDWERLAPGALRMATSVRLDGGLVDLERRVELEESAARFTVTETLGFPDGVPAGVARYVTEWTLGLGAADREGRHLCVDDGEPGRLDHERHDADSRRLTFVDDRVGFDIRFTFDGPVDLWCQPVETVSMQDRQAQRIYQATRTFVSRPIRVEGGRVTFSTIVELPVRPAAAGGAS